MENKENAIAEHLFNLNFTVSKSIIYCITEMISIHCNMSGGLSDEVSWFLSPLRP